MFVGVIPNSADFSHPADRRRYVFYFEKKGIEYESANFETAYDAVYVAISADLGQWCKYKAYHRARGRNVRVILDLSDCYLMAGPVSDALRAVYHFAVGRTSAFSLSYKKTLRDMMAASDVVLCGSEEQRRILAKLHANVIVVRDYFDRDVHTTKTSYALAAPGVLNVLWEGFSHGNIRSFRMLRTILDAIPGLKIELHVATDSEYCRVGGAHLCRPTYAVLKKVFAGSGVRFHLYDWNATTFAALAASCDLALIPIPADPIMMMKPENKLLLLWTIGLPVITTNTPAYTRVLGAIGEDFACSAHDEWRERIALLGTSREARERYMTRARRYLAEQCSESALVQTWDTIFCGLDSEAMAAG